MVTRWRAGIVVGTLVSCVLVVSPWISQQERAKASFVDVYCAVEPKVIDGLMRAVESASSGEPLELEFAINTVSNLASFSADAIHEAPIWAAADELRDALLAFFRSVGRAADGGPRDNWIEFKRFAAEQRSRIRSLASRLDLECVPLVDHGRFTELYVAFGVLLALSAGGLGIVRAKGPLPPIKAA